MVSEISSLVRFSVDDISMETIDVLYNNLTELNEDDLMEKDIDVLLRLFFLAQNVLKFKDDQLTLTMEELDSQAVITAEVEELRSENRRLAEMVDSSKTINTEKSKVLDLKRSVDELRKELKSKEVLLARETLDSNQLKQKLTEAEQEQKQLREQVQHLRETVQDLQHNGEQKSDNEDATVSSYADIIKQKNQTINMLFDEVETSERENVTMKEVNAALHQKLNEATAQMTSITAEFESLQARAVGADKKDSDSLLLVAHLRTKLAELRRAKQRRDLQFDQMAACVEQRSDQLRLIIRQRDGQIEQLRKQLQSEQDQRVAAASAAAAEPRSARRSEASCDEVGQLRKQLKQLRAQLARATVDMEATARLFDQQQQKQGQSFSVRDTLLPLRSELTRAESQVCHLKDVQDRLETQAAHKDQQIGSLTLQLKRVMAGQYGLSEAVAEVKRWRSQVESRDRQLCQLNGYVNTVQAHLKALLEENTSLRYKLDMSPHEACSLVGIETGHKQLIETLEREVQKLEEERIALKLENRKLCAQVRGGAQVALTAGEIKEVCQQRQQFWRQVKQQYSESHADVADQSVVSTSTMQLLQRVSQLEQQLQLSHQQLAQQSAAGETAAAGVARQEAVSDSGGATCSPHSPAEQLKRPLAEGGGSLTVPGEVAAGGAVELLGRDGVNDRQLAEMLNSHLVNLLQGCQRSEMSWQKFTADMTQVAELVRDRGSQLSVLSRQHTQVLQRFGDMQQEMERFRTDNQVLSAQLSQAELCQQTLATSGGDLHGVVCALHQQMALRVSELVRAQRLVRVLEERCDQSACRLRLAESELARLVGVWRQWRQHCHTDKQTMQRQLSDLREQLLTHSVDGGWRENSAGGGTTGGAECGTRPLTVREAAELTSRLLTENRVSGALQQQLNLATQCLSQSSAGPSDCSSNSRSSYLQRQNCLLREQLQHAEQRCTQLELMIGAGEGEGDTPCHHQIDSTSVESRWRECCSEFRRTLEVWLQLLTAADTSEERGAGDPPLQPTTALLSQLPPPLPAPHQSLEQQLSSADDCRSSLATVQLQLLHWRQLASGLQSRVQQLEEERRSGDQQLWRLLRQNGALKTRLRHFYTQGVPVWQTLSSQLTDLYRLLGGAPPAGETRAEGSRHATARHQLLINRLSEVLTLRCQLLQLVKQAELKNSPQDTAHHNNSTAPQQHQLHSFSRAVTVSEPADQSLNYWHHSQSAEPVDGGPPNSQSLSPPLASSRWLLQYEQARAAVAAARAEAGQWRWRAESVEARLTAEERRSAELELTVCRLQCRLETAVSRQQQQLTFVFSTDCAQCDSGTAQHHRPDTSASSSQTHVVLADSSETKPPHCVPSKPVHSVGLQQEVTPGARPPQADVSTAVTCVDTGAVDDWITRCGKGLRDSLRQTLRCENDIDASCSEQLLQLEEQLDQLVLGGAGEETLCHSSPVHWSRRLRTVLGASVVLCHWLCQARLDSVDRGAVCPQEPIAQRVSTRDSSSNTPARAEAGERCLAGLSPDASGQHVAPPLDMPALQQQLVTCRSVIVSLQQRLQQKGHLISNLALSSACHHAETHRRQLHRLTDSLLEERAKCRHQCAVIESLQRDLGDLGRDLECCADPEPAEHCDEASSSAEVSDHCSPPPPSVHQLQCRVRESEQLLAEQERAIGVLMDRLRQSRTSEQHLKQLLTRLEADVSSSVVVPKDGAVVSQSGQSDRVPAERDCSSDQEEPLRRDCLKSVFERMLQRYPRHKRLINIIQNDIFGDHSSCEDTLCSAGDKNDSVETLSVEEQAIVNGTDSKCQNCEHLSEKLSEAEKSLETTHSELNSRTLRCHRLQTDLYEAERKRRDQTLTARRAAHQLQQRLEAVNNSRNTSHTLQKRPLKDAQQVASETAVWQERKKWQLQTQRLRDLLRQSRDQCDQLTRSRDSLTELVRRLKRDARSLELKVQKLQQQHLGKEDEAGAARAVALGAGPGATAASSDGPSCPSCSSSSAVHHCSSAQCAEEKQKLRARLQLLAQKLAYHRTNVRQLKAKSESDVEQCLKELRQESARLQSANDQLHKQLSQSEEERRLLTEKLNHSGQFDSNVTGADGDSPAAASAALCRNDSAVLCRNDSAAGYSGGTISVLRRLVERLRAENLRLRHRLVYSGLNLEEVKAGGSMLSLGQTADDV